MDDSNTSSTSRWRIEAIQVQQKGAEHDAFSLTWFKKYVWFCEPHPLKALIPEGIEIKESALDLLTLLFKKCWFHTLVMVSQHEIFSGTKKKSNLSCILIIVRQSQS